MRYNRTEISDKVGFLSVIDEKFKTCQLTIRFIVKNDPETVSENAIAVGVIATTNSVFNTIAKMNEKLSSLYGSVLAQITGKRGDLQVLSVSSSWIDNRYAIDGEDITREMVQIVRDCIFSPDIQDGGFSQENFDIEKKDLLDKIDAEMNDKRSYALKQALQTALKDEPAGIVPYGSKETALKVTPQSAYKAYKNLLKNAQIEISFVSPYENSLAEETFREAFSQIERSPQEVVFRTPSPIKPEIERVSEEIDVRQCKTVMVFKSDSDDVFALRLVSMILGETPVSKLFVNVREKMNLCYYCACHFSPPKNVLTIDSGVEKSNIQKAEDEILRQLDEIKKGNFSDDELQNALASLDNAFSSVGDSPTSYPMWFFECLCDGEILTPAQKFAKFMEVSRQRIVDAANSLKPDTFYYMLSKED